MNPALQLRFDQFERDRRSLLTALSPLTEAALNHVDDSRHWSISQILMHLMTAEVLTLDYLRKKSFRTQTLGDSGIFESGKLILLILSQRLPFKYKAPSHLIAHTPTVVPLKDLTLQWDESRVALKEFLAAIPPHHLHKLVYRHHVAGRLDVAQCVTFMREHFRHHLPQIHRLLKGRH